MAEIHSIECSRCGKALVAGSLKYILSITLTADWDEHIDPADRNPDMVKLLNDLSGRPPDALENEVHQGMAFILCHDCRGEFVRDPLNSGERRAGIEERSKGFVH